MSPDEYRNDVPYDQIAKRLGVSVNSAQKIQSGCLKLIKANNLEEVAAILARRGLVKLPKKCQKA